MAKKRKAVKTARKSRRPSRRAAPAARQSSNDDGFLAAFLRLFGEPDTAKKRKL
jgi:hypothetical protein